jgi:hypothetical protein
MRTRSTHTGALCVPTSVLCVVTVGTLGGHIGYAKCNSAALCVPTMGTMGTLVYVLLRHSEHPIWVLGGLTGVL